MSSSPRRCPSRSSKQWPRKTTSKLTAECLRPALTVSEQIKSETAQSFLRYQTLLLLPVCSAQLSIVVLWFSLVSTEYLHLQSAVLRLLIYIITPRASTRDDWWGGWYRMLSHVMLGPLRFTTNRVKDCIAIQSKYLLLQGPPTQSGWRNSSPSLTGSTPTWARTSTSPTSCPWQTPGWVCTTQWRMGSYSARSSTTPAQTPWTRECSKWSQIVSIKGDSVLECSEGQRMRVKTFSL